MDHARLDASHRAVYADDPPTETWEKRPAMPGATHGNAMGCINGKLYTASGKMRAGGGPDPATATAYVLQLPQRGGTR
jgi:hypothetical protein